MNWINTFIDLGTIKQNSKITILFESKYKLDIVRVKPGCGSCTKFISYKDNKLKVIYTPTKVPKHFTRSNKNSYTTTKFITIVYKDGSQEILKFRSTVTL